VAGGKAEIVRYLRDNLVLTQYGEEDEFRDALRVEIGETEMSLIIGRQDSLAASLLVTKSAVPWASARYTTVGQLRRQRFEVVHSPTRGNPLHVSVLPPAGLHGPEEWDEPMAKAFRGCFTDPKEVRQ
jgi:hypothetical protein